MSHHDADLITREVCRVHGTGEHKGHICLECLPKSEVGFALRPPKLESIEIWNEVAENLGFPHLMVPFVFGVPHHPRVVSVGTSPRINGSLEG